jgi:hypothetical protein
MSKISAKLSNGADQYNSRRYDDLEKQTIQVNSLNVNATGGAVTAVLAGTTITPAMVADNDIFFISQGAGATDRIFLSDDLPVGTFIHLVAEDIFLLDTETTTTPINDVASKLWTVSEAGQVLHCIKTHTLNWQVTCESIKGIDVQVKPAT